MPPPLEYRDPQGQPWKCPACPSVLILREGPWGLFLACPRFPRCRGTRNVDGTLGEAHQPFPNGSIRPPKRGPVHQRVRSEDLDAAVMRELMVDAGLIAPAPGEAVVSSRGPVTFVDFGDDVFDERDRRLAELDALPDDDEPPQGPRAQVVPTVRPQCPTCNASMLYDVGQYGGFWACTATPCQGTRNLDGTNVAVVGARRHTGPMPVVAPSSPARPPAPATSFRRGDLANLGASMDALAPRRATGDHDRCQYIGCRLARVLNRSFCDTHDPANRNRIPTPVIEPRLTPAAAWTDPYSRHASHSPDPGERVPNRHTCTLCGSRRSDLRRPCPNPFARQVPPAQPTERPASTSAPASATTPPAPATPSAPPTRIALIELD